MTIADIDAELARLREQIAPFTSRVSELQRRRSKLASLAFIEANKITRDDVQMSSGPGIPWIGDFRGFGNWLRETKCSKRFCEWNGCIHFTAEVIAGKMIDTGGHVEDLE